MAQLILNASEIAAIALGIPEAELESRIVVSAADIRNGVKPIPSGEFLPKFAEQLRKEFGEGDRS